MDISKEKLKELIANVQIKNEKQQKELKSLNVFVENLMKEKEMCKFITKYFKL